MTQRVTTDLTAYLMARRIRRYDNRKLYDTEASEYVSLSDIAELVRSGETVEVVDKASGEDLTAQTLTQVILEEGKSGQQVLPSDLLHDVLRHSGEVLDSGLDLLRSAVEDLMTSSLDRLEHLVQSPRAQDVDELRQQLRRLEDRLSALLDTLDEQQREAFAQQVPTEEFAASAPPASESDSSQE